LIEKGLPWAANLLARWPGQDPGAHEPLAPSHAVAAE
ncbi:conjugal transfer protein Trbe, partial [Hyphomonas oceanitis SCH89]